MIDTEKIKNRSNSLSAHHMWLWEGWSATLHVPIYVMNVAVKMHDKYQEIG
jgi:hypothetical protein